MPTVLLVRHSQASFGGPRTPLRPSCAASRTQSAGHVQAENLAAAGLVHAMSNHFTAAA